MVNYYQKIFFVDFLIDSTPRQSQLEFYILQLSFVMKLEYYIRYLFLMHLWY